MKAKEIPYPCVCCLHMKAWNLHMNGDHDYACCKKPRPKWGEPECDKFCLEEGADNEND